MNGQPDPQPFWQSAQIRTALVGLVPMLVVLARALGLDLSHVAPEIIVDTITAGIGAYVTIRWIVKRVQVGNQPPPPSAPIESPMASVKRLTGN